MVCFLGSGDKGSGAQLILTFRYKTHDLVGNSEVSEDKIRPNISHTDFHAKLVPVDPPVSTEFLASGIIGVNFLHTRKPS